MFTAYRIVNLEEIVRDKNQENVEMEMIVGRLKQENRILEERNKIILGQLKHTSSTPLASPRNTMVSINYTYYIKLLYIIIVIINYTIG